jgi:transcriptional regulator with XRE-family HTH domain
MRDQRGWSQQQLAKEVGMNQNAISRLENPSYGKATITTLKRLAAIFDVAVVVRFVPFSQLVDWVSGTTFEDKGLSSESLAVPNFSQEEEEVFLGPAGSLNQSANFAFGEWPSYLMSPQQAVPQATYINNLPTGLIYGIGDWSAVSEREVSFTTEGWRPLGWQQDIALAMKFSTEQPAEVNFINVAQTWHSGLGLQTERDIRPTVIKLPNAA